MERAAHGKGKPDRADRNGPMYFDSPRYRRLVEALRDHPDDAALRLVLSDLVESEAETAADLARAEFIRLQVRRADLASADPEHGRAEARERELLGRFEADWRRELPELPGVLWGPYELGFVTSAVLGTVRQLLDHGPALFGGTALSRVAFRELRRPEDVAALADHAALADVRDLDLAGLGRAWPLADLLASPHLATLRGLHLAGVGLAVAEVADLARADLPALRVLDLSRNALDEEALGELLREAGWLNRLRRLDLTACRLDRRRRVRALLACPRFDALEELSLADTELLPQHLEPLLDDASLPALRRLDLRNCRLDVATLRRVLDGPLGRRVAFRLDGNPGGDLLAVLAAADRGPDGALDLAGRPLAGDGLATVLALPRPTPARRVRLAQTGLALDDLRTLLDAPAARDVEELDLSGNPFGGPEAVELLRQADLPRLRRLALCRCAFGPADVLALRGDPRLGHLEELDLAETPGAEVLALVQERFDAGAARLDLTEGAAQLTPAWLADLLDRPPFAGVRTLALPSGMTGPDGRAVFDPPGRLPELASLTLHVDGNRRLDAARDLGDWLAADVAARVGELRLVADYRHLHWGVADRALADVRGDRLERLHLERLGLVDTGLERLAAWPGLGRLRHLGLAEPEVTAKGLATVLTSDHLPALESLELHVFGVAPGDLIAVLLDGGLIDRLTDLRLVGPGLRTGDVRRLAGSGRLGSLRRLALVGQPDLGEGTGRAIAACPELAGLEELDLTGTALGDAGFRWLAGSAHLAALRVLRLAAPARRRCAHALEALAAPAGLPALRELDLAQHDCGDADLFALLASDRAARLERLDLTENVLHFGACRAVARSPLAGRVVLAGNPGLAEEEAVRALLDDPEGYHAVGGLLDSCLPFLLEEPALAAVRNLDLTGSAVGLAGARTLAAAPCVAGLRELTLDRQSGGLPDAAVAVLLDPAAFPALERLALCGNRLGDGVAAGLAALDRPGLTQLDLRDNRLGPAAVRRLLDAPALRGRVRLRLDGNPGWGLDRAAWLAHVTGRPDSLELSRCGRVAADLDRHLHRHPADELALADGELALAEVERLLDLPRLRDLRRLRLNGHALRNEHLDRLRANGPFPHLAALDLSGCQLDDPEWYPANDPTTDSALRRLVESDAVAALEELRLDRLQTVRWRDPNDPSPGMATLAGLLASRPRAPLCRLAVADNALAHPGSWVGWDWWGRLLSWPGFDRLTHLDLSGNPLLGLSLTREAAGRLPRLAGLRSLRLNGVEYLRSAGVLALLAGDGPVRLRDLGLAGTRLGTGAVRRLAESRRLRELRALDLADNGLPSDDLACLFTSDTLQRVETLDLSGNGVVEGDLMRLGRARFARLLRTLRLAGTPLSDLAPLRRLANALPVLEELDLSGCPLGPAALDALADSPLLGRLRRLTLRELALPGSAFHRLLASPRLARQEALHLDATGLGPDEVALLARNRHLGDLTELALPRVPLGDVGVDALVVSRLRPRALVVSPAGLNDRDVARLAARFGYALTLA